MAEFSFNCPQCGQPVGVDELLRGKVVECPHCEKNIVVPRGAVKSNDSNQTIRERRSSPRFIFNCSHCGREIEADESVRGQMAECPHCDKNIVVPRGMAKPQDRKPAPRPKTFPVSQRQSSEIRAKCPNCGTEYGECRYEFAHMVKCEMCGTRFMIGGTYPSTSPVMAAHNY